MNYDDGWEQQLQGATCSKALFAENKSSIRAIQARCCKKVNRRDQFFVSTDGATEALSQSSGIQ
jgi:hypothetical protein